MLTGQPAEHVFSKNLSAIGPDLPDTAFLASCDVLLAHISQPSLEELQDPTKLKDTHLGYRGTARLIHECQPTLALIGEFWAGYNDVRIDLTTGLRLRSGCKQILIGRILVNY